MTAVLRKGLVLFLAVATLVGIGMLPGRSDTRMPDDASGPDGRTPLQSAILADDYGTFLDLLRQGADPNIQGFHGMTAVHLAAQHRNGRYLAQVLDHGGNPNSVARRLKRTPLFFALDTRRPDNRDLLIMKGADIEYADATQVRPLRHAANIADVDSVLRLLELGADPTAVDDLGATFQASLFRINPDLLRWGVRRQYRKVIAYLDERGIPLHPKGTRFR